MLSSLFTRDFWDQSFGAYMNIFKDIKTCNIFFQAYDIDVIEDIARAEKDSSAYDMDRNLNKETDRKSR